MVFVDLADKVPLTWTVSQEVTGDVCLRRATSGANQTPAADPHAAGARRELTDLVCTVNMRDDPRHWGGGGVLREKSCTLSWTLRSLWQKRATLM